MAERKKKQSKKQQKVPRRPASARKLDPALLAGALRAKKEKRVKISKSKTLGVSQAPLTRSLKLGVQALAANLPTSTAIKFLKHDLVPVLIDTARADALGQAIKRWKGQSTQISKSTVCAHIPRTKLMDLASYRGVRYVEASTELRPRIWQSCGRRSAQVTLRWP